MSLADYERLSTAQVDKDAEKTAENVEAEAVGEGLKETFVEGEVHTDSSETESEIDLTQMAPTSYISGKLKLKKIPKKKKVSDEEDATYEPTPVEKEKLKKKGIRKRKARPTGEVSRRKKGRKDTTSIPIPEEVRKKTPEQPQKTVEEPCSASKKPQTSQSSSHGFQKVPTDLPSDFGDWFNDGKVNALTKKVSILEKAKAEAELKAVKEKLKDVEAENVALRNEVEELTNVVEELAEKIMNVEAQYKAIDDSNRTMMEMYADLQVSSTSANEILKKDIKALRAEKEVKDE
ncbi:putative transcription factor bZIP family [Helianthus annuus]|nr:putative transcription factor bZIP family [Helianthus annuus]